VIEIRYGDIPKVVELLQHETGAVLQQQNGRPIGVGAVSKAKWFGDGWMVWTDHFRTPSHGTTVKAFLSFHDPQQETIFRLKHSHLIK
jgi:hypothetical protein